MPTFFDLQVNGYAGVDFNQDHLTLDQLETACRLLQSHHVQGILATLITEHLDTLCLRLANLVKLRSQSPLAQSLIPGFHIEGPFISPTTGYRGAHPADAIQPATPDAMQKILDAGAGLIKLVTLAPEHDANLATTKLLAKQNITISAGHCDPSLDQLRAALDAGLTLFTHLGNGCPMQLHRHDNIIQRALSLADRLTICFIADGTHIPFTALKNYLQIAGLDRTCIVTDAISPAGLGPGRYTLGRWDLLIEEDMVARSPDKSHFVGSAITMPQTLHNLTHHLHLSPADAHRLLHDNPRRAIHLA
ncbi:MAG TPA: hypothetical protein VFE58_09480 [Tepidisphaeraceae bacterium]|jgi:N-acetylglucosamine-6-phosphate deacetylase|nr:hypothetical protein [Tepidisphaeraceae bacterium]